MYYVFSGFTRMRSCVAVFFFFSTGSAANWLVKRNFMGSVKGVTLVHGNSTIITL